MTSEPAPAPTFEFEPTHTSASKIIDAQIDLATRFAEKPFCDAFLALGAWTMLAPDAADDEITTGVAEVMYGPTGQTILNSIRTGLSEGPAYRISPDMVALALHTSDSLDESDLVDLDMAPSPHGFARLELPLPSIRDDGNITPVTWLLWYTYQEPGAPNAIVAWLFHDMNEHEAPWLAEDGEFGPEAYAEWRRKVGRWHPEWRTGIRQGESVGPARHSYATRDMEPDLRMISRGVAAAVITNASAYEDINPARFLYGLFAVMGQPVVTVEPEAGDRASRRRAARSGLSGPSSTGSVRLVALRRERAARPAESEEQDAPDHDDDSEAGRRSRIRWITRQHWRWQPYGPRKGVEHEHDFGLARAEDGIMTARCRRAADEEVVAAGRDDGQGGCPATLKRILIDAYVKGPESAPLKLTKKVYDVR